MGWGERVRGGEAQGGGGVGGGGGGERNKTESET